MTDTLPPLYDLNRDAYLLEPYYSRHVQAMTAEKLHEKSDIAAELAFRDATLAAERDRLAQEVEGLRKLLLRAYQHMDCTSPESRECMVAIDAMKEGK